MGRTTRPGRGTALASRLRRASSDFIVVIQPIDDRRWRHVSAPGVWSISKDAEHVAEAASYHEWIVRLTIEENVPSRRPPLERRQMASDLSPGDAVVVIRRRAEDTARLLLDLTDRQLDLPTRPPRARAQRLEETIDRVLIGHYNTHRFEIEAKLRALGAGRR